MQFRSGYRLRFYIHGFLPSAHKKKKKKKMTRELWLPLSRSNEKYAGFSFAGMSTRPIKSPVALAFGRQPLGQTARKEHHPRYTQRN